MTSPAPATGPDLGAYFTAHRPVVLGAAAVGVVGLALYQKRKKTTGSGVGTSAGMASPGALVGTSPAAAVVSPQSTGLGSYDSTSFDTYNALQPEIDQILAQQNAATTGSAITTAPAPASSPLLTNTAWENAAVEGWAQTGGSPLDLQTALGQYLSGQPINTAQASGVNWAMSHYGVAPGGTSGASPIVKA